MTDQILISELTAILQESKRKNTDIRTAAEKSLADLKSLSGTSEAQLGADLRKRPHFVQPFLLSCASKNPKLAGPSIGCLQRLIVSSGVHPDALKDVLDAIRDSSSLSQDVQLRILQLLPALLQNYGELVVDSLLVTALHVCFLLLGTKNAIVSNTAAATLQQLVVSVFDRVSKEDEDTSLDGLIQDVQKQDGWVSVKRAALDAHRLLNDICLLIDGQKPEFLTLASLQANSGLEMVETIFSHHPKLISSHPEMVHILRQKLFPFIIRALSEKMAFSTTVRAVRLLPVIFSNMLEALAPECEMALSLINHLLDPDAGLLWKRILCMELLRNLHLDADLTRRVFVQFDQEESRRNIVQDQMAIMVRVASEKPSAIGLGQQSTAPYAPGQTEEPSGEQGKDHSDGGSGAAGVTTTVRPSNAHGISMRFSSMKVPCLEQVDKADPPTIPPTYLYALAVTCMNNFSEGLARFLLPFTVPSESRTRRRGQTKDTPQASPRLESLDPEAKRPTLTRTLSRNSSRTPANPLDLKRHPLYDDICTTSAMVDKCWPALLAAYSTYFHAALDTDYYRGLVRAFQKFTQIAGLLRLETPRDAFLTTLSKNAMPSGPLSLLNAVNQDTRPSSRRASYSKDEDYSSESGEEQVKSAKSSLDVPRVSLNSRNLLCLRALLNLAIALGPVLGAGWTIILETLQQADFLINHVTTQRRKARGGSGGSMDDADFLGDIGSEVAAVGSAATRMLESTGDLPDTAYLDVVSSLCGLFRDIDEAALQAGGARVGERRTSTPAAITIQTHDSRLNLFVIDQIAKLVKNNNARMIEQSPKVNGWKTMTQTLRSVVAATYLDHNVRVRAAKALMNFVGMTASGEISEATREETRQLGLQELTHFVEGLYKRPTKNSKVSDEDLHLLGLETLRSMLELYGDSLSDGWEDVFAIASSVFEASVDEHATDGPRSSTGVVCRSAKLMRSSFGSLQLICSDFLASLPSSCLTSLMHSVHAFTNQQEDLNTSLTATTLYSSVADLHWRDQAELHLEDASPMHSRDLAAEQPQNLAATVSMRLFQLLSASATDSRMEVRHGAIYSLFRILESHAHRFSNHDWIICIKFVVIPMFSENQRAFDTSVSESPGNSNKPSEWNETAVLVLENTSTLLGLRMPIILPIPEFIAIWAHIISHFTTLLARESLSVSASVFISVEKIFSASDAHGLSRLVDPAWYLWLNGNPANHKETTRKIVDNQPALLAYVSCFMQLHQLVDGNVAIEQLGPIVDQIQLCVTASSPTAYAGDLDTLTPLQSEILECIKTIQTNTPPAFSLVMRCITRFVTLPFEADLTSERKGPTFIALSKTSMELLESRIQAQRDKSTLYKDGVLEAAISALWKPISLKYAWSLEGKAPPPWQRATTATVHILEATLPAASKGNAPDEALEAIWKQVLRSCAAMISTGEIDDNEPTPPPSEDLKFDIASVESICDLVVPALGSSQLSDDLRRSFAHILFEHSLIHEPHPDDLPVSYKEPLSALRSQHIGRTQDLPSSPRAAMCYKLLSALFDLVAVHDGSAARVKLAQAAAPYLILRVALTLKAYISDQPLRGRMPQPRSQRQELLWILQRLVELDAEPRAIPDAPGVVSTHKKHLFRIVPFIREALRVARRDAEVHRALERVLETLAAEFEV